MLTQEQIDSFKQIISDSGFKYIRGDNYIFKDTRTSKWAKAKELLGFPSILKKYPNLMAFVFEEDFPDNAVKNILMEISETHRDANKSPSLGDASKGYNRLISHFPILCIDKGAKEPVMLLDPETKRLADVSYASFLSAKRMSHLEFMQSNNPPPGRIVFDGYRDDPFFPGQTEEEKDYIWVNSYIPPEWRRMEVEPKISDRIKSIFEHMFSDESEREHVYDWLHHAVRRRAQTVLCLVGPQGTGKGVLTTNLFSALCGEHNTHVAGQSMLSEKFNGPFNTSKLIIFDEGAIPGQAEINKFKAFSNDKISVEGKGVDQATIINYASLILNSNEKKGIKVSAQERRFSIPKITSVPLKKIYSEEEVSVFVEEWKDPKNLEIAQFGHWLLERKPKTTAYEPIKGDYYLEICRISKPEWQTFLEDYVISKGVPEQVIPLDTFKKGFKKEYPDISMKWPSKGKVEDFINNYLYDGRIKIGTLIPATKGDKGGVLPNTEFLFSYGLGESNEKEEEETPTTSLSVEEIRERSRKEAERVKAIMFANSPKAQEKEEVRAEDFL